MGAVLAWPVERAANDAVLDAGAQVSGLDGLLDGRRLWKGRTPHTGPSVHPTGFDALDAALPSGGWPASALSEILHADDGVGEMRLAWPALARLSQAGERIVLIAPPHRPFAPAWRAAGIALERLHVVSASNARDALWAAEQCLRSGSCGAVLCWPQRVDDRTLRRLHVAAESGQTLALAWRDMAAARNPSPAALRGAIDTAPSALRVIKCRGGMPPARPIAFTVR